MGIQLKGSIVALVTPMTHSGALDQTAMLSLVDKHLEAGTQGIVLHGTTGEGITLTDQERVSSLKWVVEHLNGRIPVIAGTGSASTQQTIECTKQAYEYGADAALIVTPYYNRPTQEGLYQHFAAIAHAIPIPMILYTNPARAMVDISVETLKRLSQIPNIIGLKDPRGDGLKQKAIAQACGREFLLYSGDDPSCLEFMYGGGVGVISISANIAPQLMQQMCVAALDQNFALADDLNALLMPLHKACCIESNPIPVKWALAEMGWINPTLRLPLTPLSACYHQFVREALETAKVIGCANIN